MNNILLSKEEFLIFEKSINNSIDLYLEIPKENLCCIKTISSSVQSEIFRTLVEIDNMTSFVINEEYLIPNYLNLQQYEELISFAYHKFNKKLFYHLMEDKIMFYTNNFGDLHEYYHLFASVNAAFSSRADLILINLVKKTFYTNMIIVYIKKILLKLKSLKLENQNIAVPSVIILGNKNHALFLQEYAEKFYIEE
jgi:hypothetical protein